MVTVKFEVEMDLDMMPDGFHTKEDARKLIEERLTSLINHYNPRVKIIEDK